MISGLTKPRLAVWLLVGLSIPWQFGGKQPVAVLVDMMLVCLASFLWLRSGEAEPQIVRGWQLAPLILLAWAGLSLIWSVNRYQSVIWLEVAGLAVIVFWLAAEFGNVRQLRSDWLNGYQAVASLSAIWGIGLYLTQDYNRLTASFYLANPWAAYVLPAFLLATWRYARTGQRFSAICAPILGGALFLSDSRSAWLMLVLAAIVALVSRLGLARWRRILIVAGVAAVLIVAVNMARGRWFHHGTITQGSRFSEAIRGESTSASDRLNYLKSSVAIWKDFPLLGTGAGTFASVHPRYQYRVISASTNAHNFYVQTLSELGLVGGVLLAGVVAALGWGIIACFRARQGRAVALILGLMLLHMALDIDAVYPSIMVVAGGLAGLMVARQRGVQSAPWTRRAVIWGLGLGLVGLMPATYAYLSARNTMAAEAAQSDGDFALAGELYQAAHRGLTYDPDVVNAEGIIRYTMAGLEKKSVAAEAGLEQAKELARQAQYLDLYDAQHMFLYGRACAKLRQTQAAESAYKRAIELDPYNHPEYYADLAYLYLLNDRGKDVLSVTGQILPKYTPNVLANRGIAPGIKEYVGALYYFKSLAELAGHPGQARLDTQAAIRLDPSNQDARKLLERL